LFKPSCSNPLGGVLLPEMVKAGTFAKKAVGVKKGLAGTMAPSGPGCALGIGVAKQHLQSQENTDHTQQESSRINYNNGFMTICNCSMHGDNLCDM
jgi:hypothetical protein